MNLSEFSSEVVGFESTWDSSREVLVKDVSTGSMDFAVKVRDSILQTTETKEIGVQANSVVISNSNEETDRKLAAWLKKVLPAVEKELVEGLTPVYGNSSETEEIDLKVVEYQEIDVKPNFSDYENVKDESLRKGVAATWLSVSTQDSPVLVLSCSCIQEEQSPSFIIVFEPRRSKVDAKIYWHELSTIPVKEPIEFLTTNPQNRDMFAGASITGDLYVWNYQNPTGNESRVTELFSKTSDDSIEALAFASENRLLCCQNDGKICVYKVTKQSCNIDKIMKIEPRNVKDPKITSILTLSNSEEFIIGLFNGSLLHCSMNQLIPQDGTFNPVVRELQAHKFPVTSLKHCLHKGKNFVVSSDASSEVYFFETDDTMDKQPKLVVKLPLSKLSSGKITCRNDMKQILSLDGGSLEVIKTSTKARETYLEGKSDSSANIIELSRNESWLVTGIHNGIFKIFNLMESK